MCLYYLPGWKLEKVVGRKKCKLNFLNCRGISLRTKGVSAPTQSRCCATQTFLVWSFFLTSTLKSFNGREELVGGPVSWSVGDSVALFISSVLPDKHLALDSSLNGMPSTWFYSWFVGCLPRFRARPCPPCSPWHPSGGADGRCLCQAELKVASMSRDA